MGLDGGLEVLVFEGFGNKIKLLTSVCLGLLLGSCTTDRPITTDEVLAEKDLMGAALCSARSVALLPGGQSVILRDQVTFPKTQSMMTYQGFAYHLNWPSVREPLRGYRLGTSIRSIYPISNSKIVTVDFLNRIEVHDVTNRTIGSLEMESNAGLPLVANGYTSVSGMNKLASKIKLNKRGNYYLSTQFGPRLPSTRLSMKSSPDVRFLNSETNDGIVAHLIFEGDSYWVGSEAGRNLAIMLPNGDVIELDRRLDQFSAPDLSLARAADGALVLLAQGLEIHLTDAESTAFEAIPLYSTAVVDVSSEIILWRFGPNVLEEVEPVASKLYERSREELNKWISKGWILKSTATDTSSGKVAMLFKQIGGRFNSYPRNNTAIVMLTLTSSNYWQCRQDDKPKPFPQQDLSYQEVTQTAEKIAEIPNAEYKLDFSELPTKTGTSRIGKWTILPKEEKGILIQLRGGPATNLYDQQLTEFDKHALEDGWRIVRYEYSGATSSALDTYSRLSKSINEALELDSRLISNDIRAMKNSLPIALQATSFGARLAPFVLKSVPEVVSGTIMQAPFTYWRPPNSTQPIEAWSTSEKAQLRFDTATFGAPRSSTGLDFNEWSREVTLGVCKEKNITYFFGKRDQKVKSEDWTSVCGMGLEVIEYEGAGHGLIDDPRFVRDATQKLRRILSSNEGSK